MRVLDIDLDFFLAACCPLAENGRPELYGHEPWAERDVVSYIEANLGLSAAHPLPGRIFETHDGALSWWSELIAAGRLTAPFEVTHVDAHSDLGIGYPGPDMVLSGALPVRIEKRTDIAAYYGRGQLDEANYLLYALAFRWVSALENIRNRDSRPDVPAQIAHGGVLKLSSFASRLMEGINGAEPEIPYHQYDDCMAYAAGAPFDFVSLAMSPRYAPKEADPLRDVIARYMVLE